MPSPTIRSLAATAGVSAATVSLALRNHPRISSATRRRIRKLADAAGYQGNPVFSQLLSQIRGSKTAAYQGTLGVLYTSRQTDDIMVSTVREWITAAKARAADLGYQIDEFVLHERNMSPARLVRILDTRGIRGLLVTGPFGGQELPRGLNRIWRRSATIMLGERPVEPALSCVLNNQFLTVTRAMQEAGRLGYRRPGLCLHPYVDQVLEHRFSGGYLAAQSLLPRADRIPVFAYGSDTRKEFVQWVRHHRPDVILTLHPGIKSWIESAGLRIPRDIGLIHLDRTNDLRGWAGMHQDNEHLGIAAVEMLLTQLYFNILGTPSFQQCLFLGANWVAGATVKNATRDKRKRPTASRRH